MCTVQERGGMPMSSISPGFRYLAQGRWIVSILESMFRWFFGILVYIWVYDYESCSFFVYLFAFHNFRSNIFRVYISISSLNMSLNFQPYFRYIGSGQWVANSLSNSNPSLLTVGTWSIWRYACQRTIHTLRWVPVLTGKPKWLGITSPISSFVSFFFSFHLVAKLLMDNYIWMIIL